MTTKERILAIRVIEQAATTPGLKDMIEIKENIVKEDSK